MARLARIDHVQLAMPAGAEAEAADFYVGVLGLHEVAKPPVLAARGGAWFEGDGVVVHVGVDPAFRPATKAHPAFLVEDLEAMVAGIVAAGYDFEPDHAIDGIRRGYVADPFGNRIELIDASTPLR